MQPAISRQVGPEQTLSRQDGKDFLYRYIFLFSLHQCFEALLDIRRSLLEGLKESIGHSLLVPAEQKRDASGISARTRSQCQWPGPEARGSAGAGRVMAGRVFGRLIGSGRGGRGSKGIGR